MEAELEKWRLDNGRTAPPGVATINQEETEITPTHSTEVSDKKAQIQGPTVEEMEIGNGRTAPSGEAKATQVETETTPTEEHEGDGVDGRTGPPTGDDAHTVGTQWEETEMKTGNDTIDSELKKSTEETDMFLSEEEDGNESGFGSQERPAIEALAIVAPAEPVEEPETQDVGAGRAAEAIEANQIAEGSRHKSDNEELSKLVELTMKDYNGLGVEVTTPEKEINARKRIPEVNQRSTRSKPLTRLKDLNGGGHV